MQMQAQLRTLAGALALALAACSDDDGPGGVTELSDGSSSSSTTEVVTTGEPDSTSTGEEPGVCGDGELDQGEECDEGASNDDAAACTASCKQAVCGDELVGPGEGCDDGNNNDGDECTNACQLKDCGDGIVAAGVEECDDGDDDNGDACLNTCKLARCGDGYTLAGKEECDDGDKDNGDECLEACVLPTCGDGYVHQGAEECDDNNDDNSDACLVECIAARCGDGYVNIGIEACDDGNEVEDDGCSTTCQAPATCDDGLKNGMESDVDCGGPNCTGCEEGQACVKPSDCQSDFCGLHECVTPRHCRDIRDLGLADDDGEYLVDPDGPVGPLAPFFTYCEMTFNGGGWQAVFNMREKPVGEASAAAMLTAISANGPVGVVLPSSNSPAILTEGLVLGQFNEALYGWAPTISGDVTRYGKMTVATGLAGACYLDGFCGPGAEVGEFDIVPTGNTRILSTGKATESPHVGLGFDDQIILWGYDRNGQNGSNWGNWFDEGPPGKAGNTPEINETGWRYVIYLR